DHPLVAVAHRLAGEPGEIRTGAGLAEELAPGVLAGEHPPQPSLLHLVAAVRDDRGPGHGEPEERGRGDGRQLQLAVDRIDDLLVARRGTETPVALGEVHPRKPEVVHAPADLDRV